MHGPEYFGSRVRLLEPRDGLARRGLLVRHSVVPGPAEEATAIVKWLAEEIAPTPR